ncbi:MAG: trypsin-like peptidase domain-containing protein [Acidobacteriota bacterium]|nr:trypsin-like peptidase domain-containing protein [Acidobacteriota bacterium]
MTWPFLIFCFVSVGSGQSVPEKNSLAALDRFSESVQKLSAQVAPSVVQITATRHVTHEDSASGLTGLTLARQQTVGSGFIIDSRGYIVTNAHVVAGAQAIKVHLLPKPAVARTDKSDQLIESALAEAFIAPMDAEVVGVFREADLALLKIAATGLPSLPLADYNSLRQGQVVFAFGSREGLSNSVSMGVVSSVARQPNPDNPFIYIQTDAPINPGDSGGPLVNTKGEVVGLDTFIFTQSGGSEGIGFAIPSPLIQVVCDQLRAQGHFHRLVMGIGTQTITPALALALKLPRSSGVIISDVFPGSPGSSAGLKLNDIVTAVDGKPIQNLPAFLMALLVHVKEQPLQLELLRGVRKLLLSVDVVEDDSASDKIADLGDPEKDQIPKLGIVGVGVDKRVEAMFAKLRSPYGVLVTARFDPSSGAVTGLQPGDLIHEINGILVTDAEMLRHALDAVPGGGQVALFIERDYKLQYLVFEME